MTKFNLPSHVFKEIRNTSEALFLSSCHLEIFEVSPAFRRGFDYGEFLYIRIVKNDVLIYTFLYNSWARFFEELPYFQRSTHQVEAIMNGLPPFDFEAEALTCIGILPNLRSDTAMKFFPQKMTDNTRAHFDVYFFTKSFEKIK